MTEALLDRPTPVVRLTPCPDCADRRRTLVESDGALLGHCLGCGRVLAAPLSTEQTRSASGRREKARLLEAGIARPR
jgi:hypothetical protein